jgi:tetratricopeptide (TPR) repeat protein
MEAGTIALSAMRESPSHPGAAHYTIHSFDDPTHAILAMEAARAYGPIAPNAGHAQHMTTHIFLARGMWDDVVEANVRADAVTDRNLAARDLPPTYCGHYNEWLMYGYQQQGRYKDAEALLMGCYAQAQDERLPQGMRQGAVRSYTYMRSLNLADSRDWDGAPATSVLDLEDTPAVGRTIQAWGSGVAAVHQGDRVEAEKQYAVILDAVQTSEEDYLSGYAPVWRGTLNALLLADGGDQAGALAAAKEAAEYEASLPVDFGPPIALKPARELHGEILLSQGRAEEAMAAFEMALARTPNRVLSVAGYARAAVAADRPDQAADAYGLLADLLGHADSSMPEMREAQAFLASRAEQPDG